MRRMLKALALRPAAARVFGSTAGLVAGPLAALGFSSQRTFRAPQPDVQRAMSSVVQKANAGGSLDAGGGLGGTSGVSKRTDRKCTLILEDGSVFSGQSFGSEVSSPHLGYCSAEKEQSPNAPPTCGIPTALLELSHPHRIRPNDPLPKLEGPACTIVHTC